MKRLFYILLLGLISTSCFGAAIQGKEEGSVVSYCKSIDFVGASQTLTNTGLDCTLTSTAGAGGGDLLADGTVPLTADWDAGNSSYDITAVEFKGSLVSGDGTDKNTTVITNDRASTDATIIWDETNDEWDFNYPINVGGSGNIITFGNGETIDNANDDYIEFQGGSGADDTDLRLDLDGTYPVFDSPTDTSIGFSETVVVDDLSCTDCIEHASIADSDQADTKCIYIEDPTAADDLQSIWANKTANDFLITEIWCESDQTIDFDLQIDDGSPADVNGTDIQCAAGEAEDTSLSGDTTLAAGEELDLVVTSVASTPTWVSICWTGNWVD